jgi:DnaJ like chaperone protein
MIRWIAAIIGYYIFRFPGAIAGFILGSIFENLTNKKGGGRSFQDVFQQNTRESVTPADFELHLLSLATLVIKADGNVSQSELDYVRQYFVQSYGKERANATFKVFNEVIK